MRVNDPEKATWPEVSEDMVEMVFIECPNCSGHVGIDATYLTQVGSVETTCPYCQQGGETTECYVPEIE